MLIMLPLLLSFSCDSGWQSRLLFLLLLRLVSSSVPCERGKRWPKTISSFCTRALRKAEKNTFPLLLLLLRPPKKRTNRDACAAFAFAPYRHPPAHRSTTTRLLTPGVTHSAGKVGGNGRFSLLVVVVRSRKKRGKGRQCPEGRVTARSGYRFEREAVCQES